MALDAPAPTDAVFGDDALRIVVSPQDLRRFRDFRIALLGDLLIATALRG